MTIHPDQIKAAEAILRQYIADPAISAAGAFMEALSAYQDAAPSKKKRQKPEGEAEGFEAFYSAYPRHEARRDAAKAYLEALGRSTGDIILAGAKKYAEAKKGSEAKFVALPGSWLRADRWKDELGQLSLVSGGAAFEDCSEASWERRLDLFFGLGGDLWTWRSAWGLNPFQAGNMVPKGAKISFKNNNPTVDFKSFLEQYKTRELKQG